MIKTIFTYTLGLFSLIFTVTQNCEDLPQFDYKSYPNQPFEFEHAEIKATLQPELNLVRGLVTYTISSKINGETELILSTEESAIDDVMFNNEDIDFRVTNDSLIVLLPDSSKKGEEFLLTITWQSNGRFGLYKDSDSNFWSSKNPLSHHHWIPIFDHPRNELTFDAYFTIPLEMEVMFNGDLIGSNPASAKTKEIQFKSEIAVPTGLGFVVGDFVISEVTSGLTTIQLFSSELNFNEEERISILREASDLKKKIEQSLSIEYPWEGLNIVVLTDNFWEERTHGAGIIYLYENLGDLSSQLKRGLYAQWFGEKIRSEQYFNLENGSNELIRTALHFSLFEDAEFIDNPDTLYTISSWNNWQKSFSLKPISFQDEVKSSLSEVIRVNNGIFNFDDYVDVWYENTGISWANISSENEIITSESTDSTAYLVSLEYDELNSNVNLNFQLEKGTGEKLYSFTMTEFSFDDSTTHEVNFTGELETVSVALSPSVEFVRFSNMTLPEGNLKFGYFPAFFLLNQLRSTNPSDRALAATLLSNHSETPDLQLALNDVLNFEENPTVKAALLETMAVITNGATGTEQQFLDELNSTEVIVQKASLNALKSYSDNDQVKNALRNKVFRADTDQIFKYSLDSYFSMVSSEEVLAVAKRLQRVDPTGYKTLVVVTEYANADTLDAFVMLSEEYLSPNYPHSKRQKALQFLVGFDTNVERWKMRLKTLIDDRDPRVRVLALQAVKWLSPAEALKILGTVERDEYDVRVLLEVDNLLEQISK